MSAIKGTVSAPWREAFLEHARKLSMPVFSLATLRHETQLSASTAQQKTLHVTPRTRTVVFRGMWAGLANNPQNPAPLNAPVYESDMLTFTTDARMDKVHEIFATADSTLPGNMADTTTSTSGGGGPVEAMFWVQDAMTQWRIRGVSYILGPDIDSEESGPLKEMLLGRMRRVRPEASNNPEWCWSREITAHFGNLSPGMRGSFKQPPPGTQLSLQPADTRLKIGEKVTDLHDPVCRENFRVAVIIPQTVDQVNLASQRRWIYQFVDDKSIASTSGGIWKVCEVWP